MSKKMEIVNPMPAPVREIIYKMKFIAMIESGKKVNIRDQSFADSNSWYDAIYRSLYGEGRDNLILHIETVIAEAITTIKDYHETEFCKIIVNQLDEMKIGIANLSKTYQHDPSMVAKFAVCIDNINIQLKKNTALLEDIRPISNNRTNDPYRYVYTTNK